MLVCLALALAPIGPPVQACAFDFVKPEQTAIDRIVGARTLVLARPGPVDAFTYEVTDVLLGDTVSTQIPFLVDSGTRRRLAADPDLAVLFADDGSGVWHRLATVDATFRPVLDTALTHRADWASGYPDTRHDLIAGLQGDPDPALRSLVIAEFDRMPYAMLRGTDITLRADTLLAELWTPQHYTYQAIRVLLLGLSGDPAARAEIHAFFDRTARWDWATNLGAFAAALIEIDGAAGVHTLSDRLLLDPAQPLDKLDQAITALSVQNTVAPPEVRRAIAEAIADLVRARPAAGPLVARQFANRSDWSQADALLPLLREGHLTERAEVLTVFSYIAQARQRPDGPLRNPKTDG
jgi:hypothetical protein